MPRQIIHRAIARNRAKALELDHTQAGVIGAMNHGGKKQTVEYKKVLAVPSLTAEEIEDFRAWRAERVAAREAGEDEQHS